MGLTGLLVLDQILGGVALLAMKPFVILFGNLLRRDHALVAKGDFLVMKLLGAGSLYIALPNLLSLRRAYPDRKIHLLTTAPVAAFARTLGVFDAVHVIETNGPLALLRSAWRAYRSLFGTDTVIDLEIHSRSVTLFAVAIMSRNRLAFYISEPFWKRRISTHLLYLSLAAPIHEYYDQLFGLLQLQPVPMNEMRVHLLAGAPAPAAGSKGAGLHICVGHACSGLGQERQLSPDGWANVLKPKLAQAPDVTIEIMGAKGDAPFGEAIARRLGTAFPSATILNSCGAYAPAEVPGALDRADAFWGIDSLLLHVARALGKPTTSFWGPTDPATRLRRFDPARDHVFYDRLLCSPCVHISFRAPCKGANLCIQRISGCSDRAAPPLWLVS